jgi:hypothetical protein
MTTKDLNKAIVKEQLFRLGQINSKAAKAKDAYRARLAELEKQKDTYTPEYIKELQDKARAALQASNQALYNDTTIQIEKLQNALSELHSSLDLTDPALQTALSLIKNVGKDLGSENILKINASFAGNQSALRVLQAAYKAAGVLYDGSLDRQIYDLDSSIQTMNQSAYEALMQGGSVNALAGTIGKVAKLEGYTDFETLPDPSSVNEAARAAAGLK